MKKALFLFCAFALVLTLAIDVFAEEAKTGESTKDSPAIETQDMRYPKSPFNKLGRGALNTATCWLEVPAEVCRVSADKGPIAGYTLGLAEGFFTTLLRGATGIFDAVTFLIPPYNRPLMQPEYAVDSFCEGFVDNAEEQVRPE